MSRAAPTTRTSMSLASRRNSPCRRNGTTPLPAATADDLVEALKFLNFEPAVIVTQTVYGNDNSVSLAAIEKLGRDRARGVALVDEATSSETLDSMMMGGITGIRLFLGGATKRCSTTAAANAGCPAPS